VKDQSIGTYTFVFTDIEGSTKLVRTLGDEYAQVLRDHDAMILAAATHNGGEVFGSEGDAQNLVFADAASAVRAAADAQRALDGHAWPKGQVLRVRMGIHSGEARHQGEDFMGMTLHETARIASAGHGGQVLLSPAARELARDALPRGVTLRDLGEHSLKDIVEPTHIYQLEIEGLSTEFPSLRTAGGGRTRLPTQLSSFVGRAEVDALKSLVDGARLVTLTGPGGTGKTRLSIEVASEMRERFPDGTNFVALDAVTDPGLVMSEVASKLSLVASAEAPIDRVIAYLRDRHALLVLDNFEQVVEAAPDVSRARDCKTPRHSWD
jgi:class 3 adenylate cyclase